MLLNVVTVVTELRLLRGKFARRMRCSYGAVHVPLMNSVNYPKVLERMYRFLVTYMNAGA